MHKNVVSDSFPSVVSRVMTRRFVCTQNIPFPAFRRSVEKELYRKYCVYVQTERSYIYFVMT